MFVVGYVMSSEMCEVLVKDESERDFKIRYIGITNVLDTWVKKDEVLTKIEKSTDTSSIEDRTENFLSKCAVLIKKNLCLQNSNKNLIKITLDVDQDVYSTVFDQVGSDVIARGVKYTVIPDNTELDPYLGSGWNLRMLNRGGDFVYIVPGTFKVSLKSHVPIKEYVPSPCGLVEKWVWQGMFCEIDFIPGFGTGEDYFKFMWYSSDTLV